MKITYLVWKDPNCNGVNPEWEYLSRKKFLALVKSPKGDGRQFIKLNTTNGDGSDGKIVIEATEAEYKDWLIEKRHRQYLRDINPGYTEISYHAIREEDDDCSGEEILADETVNVLDDCLLMMDKQILKSALEQLTPEEHRLIAFFYLSDEQGTERDFSTLTGIPQKTVNDRKNRVLKKLKKYFEN